MSHRLANYLAVGFLIFIFTICLFSISNESLTMDELAHLPAGYSYLVKQDMRLNPEHPPLIKDLAGIPLLFIKGINFPEEIKPWQDDVNGQWDFGNRFLFWSDNPADKMIFWARIPMILILVIGGLYVFLFAKEFFGPKVGLLALFLYSFSPTLLAHGRLVTTDVGIAVGVLISFYYFLRALREPTKKNIFFAGIGFGLALLLKFTAVFLMPCFIFLTVFWAILKGLEAKEKKGKIILDYALMLFSIFFIAGLFLWPVYAFHVLKYPPERQARDIEFVLSSHPVQLIEKILPPLAYSALLRPYAQYLYGLAMVFQRGVGGNTTYFMGEISASGWKTYFPVIYLIKETLVFHLLTGLAVLSSLWLLLKEFLKKGGLNGFSQKFIALCHNYFPEISLSSFIVLYWGLTLASNLNIGVRHLIPVIPLTMILVARFVIKNLLKEPYLKVRYGLLAVLLLWQAVSVVSVYPHFIAYFNELIGGSKNGYLYAADSNLDWGQDVKRLKKWVDEQGIDKIYMDVFGGTDARYYFKEKFRQWCGTCNPNDLEKGSYLAVSATFFDGGRGQPVSGFTEDYGYYHWLDNQELVTTIGHSIFVYRIK